MALTRNKYKRIDALFEEGQVLVLEDDGTDEPLVIFRRRLTAAEKEQCQEDGNAASARLAMALRGEGAGGQESQDLVTFRGRFLQTRTEDMIEILADWKTGGAIKRGSDAAMSIMVDPDWAERVRILQETEDLAAETTQAEKDLVKQVDEEAKAETLERAQKILDDATADLQFIAKNGSLEDEAVLIYVDHLGQQRAIRELRLTQMMLSLRVCAARVGERDEDGHPVGWDHSLCEGHRLLAYETKQEIKDLPNKLALFYQNAIDADDLTVREVKNLPSVASSSDSSALTASQDSTPSTAITEGLTGRSTARGRSQ